MRFKIWAGAGSLCLLLAMGWFGVGSGQEGRPEPPGLPPLPGGETKPTATDKKPDASKPPAIEPVSAEVNQTPVTPPGGTPKSPPTDLPADGPPRLPTSGLPNAPPAVLKPAVTGQAASINVQCPANATIWIEGQKMNSVGAVRSFQSPPLEPGKAFFYSFKVSWPTSPGQPDFAVEQEVTVRAGQSTVLDFRPQQVQQPITQPYYPAQPSRPPIFRRPEGSGYRY